MPGTGKEIRRPAPVSQNFEGRVQSKGDCLFRTSVHTTKIVGTASVTETEVV
jgi:hypothetical protein